MMKNSLVNYLVLLSILVLGQSLASANYQVEHVVPKQPAPQPLFDRLTQVAAALDGSVWVVDFSASVKNVSIQHFKQDGSLITKFGSYGSAAGQFQSPSGLAIAADGSVWVADSALKTIQHFNADGVFIASLGSAGQFPNLDGIALATDGSLWVISAGVQHLNADGTLISRINENAHGIATAPDGSIWLLEGSTFDIIRYFKSDGSLIMEFKAPLISSRVIGVGADGSVWTYFQNTSGNGNVIHYSPEGQSIGLLSTSGDDLGQIKSWDPDQAVFSIAADNSLWVIDTPFSDVLNRENPRLQHFKADGTYIAQIGALNIGGQFSVPSGIAVAADNSVWVVDMLNNRIQQLDSSGNYLGKLRLPSNSQYLIFPTSIAMASDGSIWIANRYDIAHKKIDGTLITGINDQNCPGGCNRKIDVAPDDSVWVINMNSNLLRHFKADGQLITEINFGNVTQVDGLAIASDGSVWVVNSLCDHDNCIQHYTAEGKLIMQFGSKGSAAGQFSFLSKSDIAIAKDGSLWVLDSGNDRVQHLSADGQFIEQFGSSGQAAGQFHFSGNNMSSGCIALAADGSVWVTEPGNNRIQKFISAPSIEANIPVITITPSSAAAPGTPMTLSITSPQSDVSYQLCSGSSAGKYGSPCMPIKSTFRFKMPAHLDIYGAVKAINVQGKSSALSNELHVTTTDDDVTWDESSHTATIRDVKVGATHYRVKLILTGNPYFGLQSTEILNTPLSNQPANYDDSKQDLTIPLAQVNGRYYQVTLHNIGKYSFRLDRFDEIK